MATDPPAPPQPVSFTADGIDLAGLLYRPAGQTSGALLVCHGAGSRKENHGIMGEQAAAAGLAALTFDFRGHGDSGGMLDPDGWHDVVAAAQTLQDASGASWVAARGASMGGCMLLLAARARPGLFASLVALCPADGPSLLAGLDELDRESGRAAGVVCPEVGRRTPRLETDYRGRFDAAALRPFLARLDLVTVARGMQCVLLAHARDDETVPFVHSERIAAVLAPPTRFIALARGGHHAPGRSPEVARATLEWVKTHAPATG